jgi:hypothetical protein
VTPGGGAWRAYALPALPPIDVTVVPLLDALITVAMENLQPRLRSLCCGRRRSGRKNEQEIPGWGLMGFRYAARFLLGLAAGLLLSFYLFPSRSSSINKLRPPGETALFSASAAPHPSPTPSTTPPVAALAPAAAAAAAPAPARLSTRPPALLSAKLSARPPRAPPPWLAAGLCGDPLEQDAPVRGGGALSPFDPKAAVASSSAAGAPLQHAVGWSATSGAHEEHTGDTLLGACACPLRSPPPDGWAFDCGDYDWRILSDLAPWHSVNITHEMLDYAYEVPTGNVPPGYHFSVSGGRVFYKSRPPYSVYHGQLLDMLRTVAAAVALPDCEFVLHAWDHAKVWRQDPVPVFSFIRDAAKNDVTVPYPYAWGGGDFDVGAGAHCPPLAARSGGKVMWRGGCTGPATEGRYHEPFWPLYLRYRAGQLTAKHGDVLDAGLADNCLNSAPRALPFVDLSPAGACSHKFLLLMDGNTASGRSSRWVHAGAVLLKPDSVFSEWYYHLLRPWVHYIPVREFLEDLPEQAAWAVKEAPPAALQCLADNLRALAIKHVRKEAAACYWWRLLSAWAEKQHQTPRTEGFAPV